MHATWEVPHSPLSPFHHQPNAGLRLSLLHCFMLRTVCNSKSTLKACAASMMSLVSSMCFSRLFSKQNHRLHVSRSGTEYVQCKIPVPLESSLTSKQISAVLSKRRLS
jgi:hypothetical protein